MKAMIFAAGLGTRLYPLTKDRPKALVEIDGKPILGHLIHKLHAYGFDEFVVNVHHFANLVIQYLKFEEFADYKITISDEREALLETGGGLLKAAQLLKDDDPVLIHNVDIWTDMNYSKLLAVHREHKAFATLAVRNRDTSRYLLFNEFSKLVGWKNIKTNEVRMVNACENTIAYAFSGVQMVSQDFLSAITGSGKFSIIESYLKAAESKDINAFIHENDFWMDLGKPESIEFVNNL
ncbi:MAG: nucleotidyltransferase family protein [Bacteroidota bacterium]|nr:nucleotidyltransferase family protein [Bacteroidota bacterium]